MLIKIDIAVYSVNTSSSQGNKFSFLEDLFLNLHDVVCKVHCFYLQKKNYKKNSATVRERSVLKNLN